MQYPELDELLSSIAAIEGLEARKQEAFDDAVGTFVDEPMSPTVVAMVWRGKLAHLEVADGVCKLPADEATQIINRVMINAFAAWRDDYLQRARVISTDRGM